MQKKKNDKLNSIFQSFFILILYHSFTLILWLLNQPPESVTPTLYHLLDNIFSIAVTCEATVFMKKRKRLKLEHSFNEIQNSPSWVFNIFFIFYTNSHSFLGCLIVFSMALHPSNVTLSAPKQGIRGINYEQKPFHCLLRTKTTAPWRTLTLILIMYLLAD